MNSVLCRVSQVRGGLGRTKPGHGSIAVRQICQLVGVFIAPVCHELGVRGSVRAVLSRNLMATFYTRSVTASRVSFFLNSFVQYCNLKYKTNVRVSWKFGFFITKSHSNTQSNQIHIQSIPMFPLLPTVTNPDTNLNCVPNQRGFQMRFECLRLGRCSLFDKLVNSMAN